MFREEKAPAEENDAINMGDFFSISRSCLKKQQEPQWHKDSGSDTQSWAALTCCSRCSWTGWGLPEVGWSDCLPWSPCYSCCSLPQRWWLSHLHYKDQPFKHLAKTHQNLSFCYWCHCRSLQTDNLPLKHWIHFRRSSRWPPTSNILGQRKLN